MAFRAGHRVPLARSVTASVTESSPANEYWEQTQSTNHLLGNDNNNQHTGEQRHKYHRLNIQMDCRLIIAVMCNHAC